MLEWPALGLDHFPLTHLWFLYYLILIYAVVLVARAGWVGIIDGDGSLRRRLDRWLSMLMRTPLMIIPLSMPLALALLFSGGWEPWFGVPTPSQSFVRRFRRSWHSAPRLRSAGFCIGRWIF